MKIKSKKILNAIAITLGVSGIALIWAYSSWHVALGAFLFLHGDNISKLAAKL